MTTMVVVASKHGSTAEIGEHIAATLKNRGVSAHVKDVSEAGQWLFETDNVVMGLPVYRDKLWGPAKMFLDAHRTELGGKPLFLFASGGGPSLKPELAETLRSYPYREAPTSAVPSTPRSSASSRSCSSRWSRRRRTRTTVTGPGSRTGPARSSPMV
ncbi:flavodoxin domain-containing protein [Nesterenkonia sp. AN1]|uniref:flavodoxin domain-containing protein n=1 Tax=Nesterenkonia sp. AN1 TaxID=652017 RepID=UPI0004B153D9|nr:flavodoxin domain-containing protein [Nesterenkonia sp. AN1]